MGAVLVIAVGFLGGCSQAPQSPPVAGNIRTALGQAGLKDVSVTQDREKGVVTLGGHVGNDADKARASQIAQSLAAAQVVAGPTKTVYADLDKGIASNLDAALISAGYRTGIRHEVKNGVVTLTGTVDTEDQRQQLQKIAQGVPNAQQVVNEIQTRHQKASSTN